MVNGRSIKGLAAFVAAFFLFARLRSYADNTGVPIRYRYPVRFDRWLFGGNDPVTWLQSHLGQTNHLGAIDYLLVLVYISYFVVPPATVALLWWTRSRAFPAFALTIVCTLYVGLAINFIVPTAPPWLAAEHGYLTYFPRLVPRVLNHVMPGIFKLGDNTAGPNDVAAMPSLHIGIVSVVAFYLMTRGRLGVVVGSLYIVAMSFALVFLGEHYMTDIAAGILVALTCWLAVRWTLSHWYWRGEAERPAPFERESAGARRP